MSIGISPSIVSTITPKTSIKCVGAFAPTSKPDPMATINKFKNSDFGKKIIEKAGKIIKIIAEKFSDGGLIKKTGDIFKKGAEFVAKTFKTIIDNPVVKKICETVGGIIKNTKPVA